MEPKLVGEMVLHGLDLGTDCSKIRDVPVPSSNDEQDKIGYISAKKHLHPRAAEETFSPNEDIGGDYQDKAELARKKRAKKNKIETEAGSSSLSDYSCFVAHVTASNLHENALYLPQYFTSSIGLKRESRHIFLTDEGENSWALELRYDVSSETFYINRGWRCFCDVNGKKAGDFFVFKLLENGEIPLLSYRPSESGSNRRQRECPEAIGRKSLSTKLISEEESSEEECSSLEKEKKKNHLRWRDSAPSSQKQFVTLTLRPYNVLDGRLRLPIKFTRGNDINKPMMITLLGKDHIKQQVKLLVLDKRSGTMSLGDGWKDFVKASGLKAGDSFTLELTWEDKAPVLTLCRVSTSIPTKPSNGNTTKKAMNKREERRDSTSLIQNRFVTVTVTRNSLRLGTLHLPFPFMRENGITRPGKITLVGKDSKKWVASLLQDCRGTMSLGSGWKGFVEANGLRIGESFTFESIWENETPMLSLCGTQSTSEKMPEGECSKASEKESVPTKSSDGNTTKKVENNREESRDSTSPIQSRFVTLTLTNDSLKRHRLHLPLSFVRENGLIKPGLITLLGKDGRKWLASLLQDYEGSMSLGNGWKHFAEANSLKIGESFTFESIWENGTPILSLFGTESISEKMQGECSKAIEKESISTEPNSAKQDQES